MKLNIGCGQDHKIGYKNIDISKECSPDIVQDIRSGLPFKDSEVEEVFAGCIMEQIGNNDHFILAMNDIWRVLEPNGWFIGYVPHFDPRVLFLDPMDKRFFRKETFEYFTHDKVAYERFGKQYGFKPWKNVEITINDNGILHFRMQPYGK